MLAVITFLFAVYFYIKLYLLLIRIPFLGSLICSVITFGMYNSFRKSFGNGTIHYYYIPLISHEQIMQAGSSDWIIQVALFV